MKLKRILSLTLAVVMTVIMIPFTAQAVTDGYYTYKVEDGVATITDVSTKISGDVVVPDKFVVSGIGEYPVAAIDDRAFEGCSKITSVEVPDGVLYIGNRAFDDCILLESVTIADSVISIGDHAFYNCYALKNVKLPKKIIYLNDYTFAYCTSLSKIEIPEHVVSFGEGLFLSCKELTEINIPNDVVVIGSNAFDGCKKITSVVIPEEITIIQVGTFNKCSSLQNVVLPDGLTEVGSKAFAECTSLESIELPETVETIHRSAFIDCTSLKSITIHDNLKIIADYAFNGCSALERIYLPDSLETISSFDVFGGCTSLVVIDCYKGSVADTYAQKNGFICNYLERPAVPGDASGDGKVTLEDVASILKHIASWTIEINIEVSDVTGDGRINLDDVVLILKYIAKWNVVLGSGNNNSGNNDAKDEPWRAAYAEYLNANLSRDSQWSTYEKGEGRFILEDIDGDNTPELFIIDIHDFTEILTYKNDTLRKYYFTHSVYQTAGLPVVYTDLSYLKNGEYIMLGLNRYVPAEDTGVGYVKYIQDCILLERDGEYYFDHFDPDFVAAQDWMFWRTYEYTKVTESELYDLFLEYGYFRSDYYSLEDSTIYNITPYVIKSVLG